MRSLVLFLIAGLLVCVVNAADFNDIVRDSDPIWICENYCKRTDFDENDVTQGTTLETCNMLCGELPLWPKPTYTNITNKNWSTFSKNRIIVRLNAPEEIKNDLREASNIFMKNLPKTDDLLVDYEDTELFNIYINVSSHENVLHVSTNESYSLSIIKLKDSIEVNITAPTFFGARHGLETLSQLIWADSNNWKLNIIHDVEIYDSPKFAHRGIMVDTARNYFYINQLRKVVDGMAASKLNVFHLHLTDASSFPVVLPRNELFAKYGAYSLEMVYTAEDIKDLVEYARIRGIRVLLEVDAPSHVSPLLNNAKEDLVICGEEAIFNGHLNPDNNETIKVLEDIYKDLLELGTDNEMFHIGGDEVNLTCWNQALNLPEIRVKHGFENIYPYQLNDAMLVWSNFTNSMFDALVSANDQTLPKHIVIWSSDLTDYNMPLLNFKENVVVQYWYGQIQSVFNNGNKIIFSTVGRWYLDCGYGSWKTDKDAGVCDPYTSWQTVYKYRPWNDEYPDYLDQVLGGEACLWSEMVEIDSLETRIWPRGAALAERLWSDPDKYNRSDVYNRLDIHRKRLKSRGVKSEAIWPRWCSINPGRC